jgi:hypothetical protein
MPAKLILDGLDDMKQYLRQLPETLRDDARAIVHKHVDDAEAEIRAGYTRMTKSAAYGVESTGNLLAGLLQTSPRLVSRFGVGIVLRSRAPHAWLVENGSELRSFKGAPRGRMPAAHVFVPAAMRARRGMWRDLVALLERNGLVVTHG